MGVSLAETVRVCECELRYRVQVHCESGPERVQNGIPRASDKRSPIKAITNLRSRQIRTWEGSSSLGALTTGVAPLHSARPSPVAVVVAAGPRPSRACAVHSRPDCSVLPRPRPRLRPRPRQLQLQLHSAQQQPHTHSATHPIRSRSSWVGASSTTFPLCWRG